MTHLLRPAWLAVALTLPLSAAADAERGFAALAYPSGGETLYCQTPFAAGDRISVERIYPERTLLQHFGCSNALACRQHADYLAARDDPHQMFPSERRMDLLRRDTLFGELRQGERGECGVAAVFQTFDPPAHARGDVARAMLYMHTERGVPLVGPLEMYQRWSVADPPDEAERARHQRIAAASGRRNPYVDAPQRVQQVSVPGALR